MGGKFFKLVRQGGLVHIDDVGHVGKSGCSWMKTNGHIHPFKPMFFHYFFQEYFLNIFNTSFFLKKISKFCYCYYVKPCIKNLPKLCHLKTFQIVVCVFLLLFNFILKNWLYNIKKIVIFIH